MPWSLQMPEGSAFRVFVSRSPGRLSIGIDLHDVGAEPGQRLGERRAGFELRKIDDFDAEKGRLASP